MTLNSEQAGETGQLHVDRLVRLTDNLTESLAAAERMVADRSAGIDADRDVIDLREYRDIICMKVKLDYETARVLAATSWVSTSLAETARELRNAAGPVE